MTRTIKRSVIIAGHATSVSLEGDFWDALKEIARAQDRSLNDIVTEIDLARTEEDTELGLSSAIRLYILSYYRSEDTTERSAD